MKCRIFSGWLGVLLLSAFTFASSNSAFAQGTAFTYQGQLLSNSNAANGNFDMQFKLHPSTGTTNQTGPTIVINPVGITNGLFTVTLDFGSVFSGSSLFLEVGLRPVGSASNYTILSPIQPITSAPYAARAATAGSFTGVISDSQLSTNIARFDTGGGFTGPVVLANGSGNFSGTLSGTFSGTTTGTNTGTFIGNTTGTNTGTFIGNGAGVTNVNITNITGIVQSNPNWQLLQTSGQVAASGNNYLSTNNTNLSLVLPTAPGIGSIIRIAGSGANGWKLTQNAGQSIITANLGLPAGQLWSTNSTTPSQSWHAVTSSANGLIQAAAYGTGFIYYSADGGRTWAKSDAPSGNWTGLASSADGIRMVAVQMIGNIYTSTNSGSNWIVQAGSPSASYTCVASSADGVNLYAAVGNGTGPVYLSKNSGTNWTTNTFSSQNWQGIACSSNGTKVVAVPSGAAQIYVSSDSGVTWSNRGPSASWSSVAASADGNKLVATVNGGNIHTSGDGGVTWTPRASSQTWKCVTSAADGTKLAAAYSTGFIFTSSNAGQTWIQRTNGISTTAQTWSCITSSADGSRLLAGISTGLLYDSTASTTVSTGSLAGTQYSSIELQYIGNGQWMPLTWTGSFTGN